MHFTPAVRCRTLLLAIFTVLAATARVEAQCALQWQSTGGYPGADGVVSVAVEWDPDGAGPAPEVAVVGGEFTAVGDVVANHVGAFNVATNSWSALGNGTNGPVRALLGLPNGELIVAGAFTSASGVAAANVARWDGVAFHALGAGVDGEVHALARLPNGDLVVGGHFQLAGGAAAANLARWDGVAWSAFGSGANAAVLALAATPTGELFAGGEFTTIDGTAVARIARWSGSWAALGTGAAGNVTSLASMGNGDVVAVGLFSSMGGVATGSVARWDGFAWNAMSAGLSQYEVGYSVRTLASGIVVLGTTGIGAKACEWSGSTWVELMNGLAGAAYLFPQVNAVARLPNGDTLIGGTFTSSWIFGFVPYLVRVNSIGQLVPFGSSAQSPCASLCELPSGAVVAATQSGLRSYAAGSWSTFLSGGSLIGVAVAAYDSGEVVVAGSFTLTTYPPPFYTPYTIYAPVVKVAPASANQYLSPLVQSPSSGTALARTQSGQMVLAWSGLFGSSNYFVSNLDGYWFLSAPGPVSSLAVFGNGDYVVSANSSIGSQVERFNGTAWTPLGNFGADATTLAVMSNGDLIAGGGFTSAAGMPANRIARWDGTAWSTLGAGLDGPVYALLELPNGDLIAGGAFTMAGGAPAANLARWNGASWSALATTMNGAVDALMLAHDGTLWVGGAFTVVDNVASSYVARLVPTCPATATTLGAGCTGTGGLNTLTATSLPWQDSTFRSQATGLAPNSIALVVNGLSPLSIPLPLILPIGVPGCDLLASPDVLDLALPNAGVAAINLPLPSSAVLLGQSIWQQVVGVELDALGLSALTSTNALQLTVGVL